MQAARLKQGKNQGRDPPPTVLPGAPEPGGGSIEAAHVKGATPEVSVRHVKPIIRHRSRKREGIVFTLLVSAELFSVEVGST